MILKNIEKLEIMIIILEYMGGASRLVCNIRYKNTGKIQVVLHNGLNYYYHLIFKKLREECEGQFECLRESLSTP